MIEFLKTRKMSSRWYLIALLGLGMLSRLTVLFLSSNIAQFQNITLGGDAVGYIQLANNLFHEQTFRFLDGEPTAYRMPGYPIFLAFFFSPFQNPLLTQLVQIAVDLVSIAIIYKSVILITSNARASFFAAMVIALYPLIVISSITLYPETLSIFMISVSIYTLLKVMDSYWYGLLATLALSVAIYLKPTIALVTLFLLFAFGLYWIFSNGANKKTILQSLLPFVILGAFLTPWIIRNQIVMQAFIPLTTNGGGNLYGGNNPAADGGNANEEPFVLPNMSEVESDRIYRDRALSWIKSNPASFIKILPAKFAKFFWPLSFAMSGNLSVPVIIFWPLLIFVIGFYAIVVYGLWSLMVSSKRYWETLILAGSPIILLGLSLLFYGAARFALPAFPSFAVFSAIGIESLIFRRKDELQKTS